MYLSKNEIKQLYKNDLPKVNPKVLESLLRIAEKRHLIKRNSKGEFDEDQVRDYVKRIFGDSQTTKPKHF